MKILTQLKKIPRLLIYALLFLVFFFPFYWMFITSIKTLGETVLFPPSFFPAEIQWSNYLQALTSIPFTKFLTNSIVVTCSVLVLQMIVIIPCAYAFAQYNFKGNKFFFGILMVTMMMPAQLIFLPLFVFFARFKMINTYPTLILPFIASAFGIFMLRQTFKQVPKELIEAAKLDNANEFKIITKIFLPLARPTIITLALLTFVSTWNDYFWPLVMTTKDTIRTLPVGIASMMTTESGINYNILMAGNMLLILPILIVYFLAQKQIIKAFTYTGDK